MTDRQVVQACNALTARWAAVVGTDRDAVLCGTTVWPLLAVLAAGASGEARKELEIAVGVDATESLPAASTFLSLLTSCPGLSAALAVWIRPDVLLSPEWVAGVPEGTVRAIADQASFDQWARVETRGLIESFPVRVAPEDRMILAGALAATTQWREPFSPSSLTPNDGPWAGHDGPALYRSSGDVNTVSILEDDVVRLVVQGDDDLDVHLLLGADLTSAITTGIAAVSDPALVTATGSEFKNGLTTPGLSVTVQAQEKPGPRVEVLVPPFSVDSTHNLAHHAEVFGLTAALDSTRPHFDGLTSEPLAVDRATQRAIASFSADGFKVAAITALAVGVGGIPSREHECLTIEVTFDRPFGFLAVHRPTGLGLAAGLVTTPAETAELKQEGSVMHRATPDRTRTQH